MVPMLCGLALFLAASPIVAAETIASRSVVRYDLDRRSSNAIVLENEHLKAVIVPELGGQILSLIDKASQKELSSPGSAQGYCTDRMGESRYFWSTESAGHEGRILDAGPKAAGGEVSYLWNYNHNNVSTRIRVKKTYTLRAGESVLWLTWSLSNEGSQPATMTPWLKHVGGRDKTLLAGPSRLVQEQGVIDRTDFSSPLRDWMCRPSGEAADGSLPMVCSVVPFARSYQQYPWQDERRFTLETILRNTRLEPGQTWELQHALLVTANLRNVTYVTPELAAAVTVVTKPAKAGAEVEVQLELAPAADLGEVRLEGEVVDRGGTPVAPLPRRQVKLSPRQAVRLTYRFTPEREGVYDLNLTLYREQEILPLGKWVDSQESGLVLPVVIGAAEVRPVFAPWKAGAATWRQRQARTLDPLRVLTRTEHIAVAQVPVLERVFKEDTVRMDGPVQDELKLAAAAGEWESGQFVIAVPADAPAALVSIELTPPASPSGATLPPVELYQVKDITTTTPSGYRAQYPVGDWPDPLWKFRSQAVPPGQQKTFWITAYVPPGTEPNIYRGTITVRLDNRPAASFAVAIEVFPFALPQRPALHVNTGRVGWYQMPRNLANLQAAGYVANQHSARELEEAFWQMTTAYGISPRRTSIEHWQRYKDHGRGITGFQVEPDQGGGEAEAWLKQNGLLGQSYTYAPFDEHTDAEIPEVTAWAKQLRQRSQVPIMDVYYGKQASTLFGLVDIWCGQDMRQDWIPQRRNAGDQFWSTNNSLIWFIEYPPIQGRAEFWGDFAQGVDGRLLYSVIRWSERVYESNWSGGGNYLGCTIYPSPDGLAKSIRFETIRDGIEDYDYLAILRTRVATYRKQARTDRPEALAEAEQTLSASSVAEGLATPEKLMAKRSRIADLIVALGESAEGPK